MRRRVTLQRLFVFESPMSLQYVVPQFFGLELRRFMKREDIDLSRSAAVARAQELAVTFFEETVSENAIICTLPKRVQVPGLFKAKPYEIGTVLIPVLGETCSAYQQFLRLLPDSPQEEILQLIA